MSESSEMSSVNRLFKATALMASGTMISRILGFVRVALIAFILSNGQIRADILTLATQVPTNVYMLFAGGALNTVLVPQIVRAVQNDDDGGEAFVNRIMTAFLTVMAAVAVIMTLLTPQVMKLFTAPSWRTPARAADWSTLVSMSYITMPQLFFLGAFFLLGQVLNAKGRFGPMMWAPIVNNVVSILVLLLYIVIWGTAGDAPFTVQQQWLLAGGSTIGIILQTAAMIPFAKKIGFKYQLRWDWRGHGLGHVMHVAKWAFGYVAVIQIMAIMNSALASSATASALPGELAAGTTVFNNSYLIYILPHSLITVSMATALMPLASELAAKGNLRGVADETMRTMRLALTAAIPVSFGFLTLGIPFARLAFGNGRGAADSVLIAWTLMCFAIGLTGFTIQFLCLRAFYALEDTRSAFWLQCIIGGIQAVSAAALVLSWEQPATVAPRLAIAQSLAYTVGAVISYRWLQKKLVALESGTIVQHIVRLTLATLPAAVVAGGWAWWFRDLSGLGGALVQLLGGTVLALGLFVFVAAKMRIPEIQQIHQVLFRRKVTVAAPDSAPETEVLPVVDMVLPPEYLGSYEEGETTSTVGPLAYPEVDDPMPDIVFPHPDSVTLRVGQVLDGRYMIDDIVATYETVVSWRAFDQLLGRAVLLHVLVPHTEQTRVLLEEARRAAIATDARFLRVLDVVEEEAELGCSYIVGEYVGGQTLTKVLHDRMLSPMQAAWIGHEVAESLATMHGMRLYHGRLTPDSVLITSQGAVKVIPFQPWMVNKAPAPDPVAHDLASVGWLMFAALTATWPGVPMCGIPAAKVTGTSLPWPPAVAEHLPIELDSVIKGLMLASSQASSVSDVSTQLAELLASYDGTASLAALMTVQRATPVMHTPAMSMSSPPEAEDTATIAGSPFTDTTAFTPVPPPPAKPVDPDLHGTTVNPEPRRFWLLVLAVGFALALVINLVALGFQPPAEKPAAPSVSPQVSQTISVVAFDPKHDGGDAAENNLLLPYVTDGDLKTCWKSEDYHKRPDFGGLKKGVGVVLDLGKVTEVNQLRVTLHQPGVTAQLRVPAQTAKDKAPMGSREDWRTVAEMTPETATFTFKPEAPVKSRFVLIYFTKLAADGKEFTAGVCDVQVNP